MQCKNDGVSSVNGTNADIMYYMSSLMVKMVPVTMGTEIYRIMTAFTADIETYTSLSSHFCSLENRRRGIFMQCVRSSWQHGKRKRKKLHV